jgi:hypothetical protein
MPKTPSFLCNRWGGCCDLTVPLCRWTHHTAASRAGVHAVGNEAAWWRAHNLDPLPIAARLWAESEVP